jgi:hypothetical protein
VLIVLIWSAIRGDTFWAFFQFIYDIVVPEDQRAGGLIEPNPMLEYIAFCFWMLVWFPPLLMFALLGGWLAKKLRVALVILPREKPPAV